MDIIQLPITIMASKGPACLSYVFLKPEEATFIELIRLLFSSDIEKRNFITSSAVRKLDFKRRLLIFFSTVIQCILLLFRKPMAWLGGVLEKWLNLVSSNGGLLMLILNWLKGYEKRESTQAFVFQDTTSDPNLVWVAFRGTEPFSADDWRTDFDISWCEFAGIGKTHGGFMKALGMQTEQSWPLEPETEDHEFAYYKIRQILMDLLQENKNAKFILTGHSLGGALAVLFASVLAMHDYEEKYAWLMEKLEGVYTFGQPRVGDEKFAGYVTKKLKNYGVRYMRYVYSNDLVPRVPFDDTTLLFKHVAPCLYFNSFYKGKELEEAPNKNYFNLLFFIPMRLNALWELIRSFILPLIKGSEYKESWLMIMARFFGLIFPGLVAHAPQDYVNVTRLGSIPSHMPLPKAYLQKINLKLIQVMLV
ncbi:triacylglycerol lipase OBL1-like isoform X2 [Pyrus communis]|uniref:triacylglycerol lipase OBL1-like isoform X2 n=1 Tax=Pyrus communis TaxID=23211 RepID=UPI0035C1A274